MDANALLSFHLTTDSATRQFAPSVVSHPVAHRVGFRTEERHILVCERSLSFQFSPHYHPWVTELTRRLLAGSTAGLEAVDTEYGLRVHASAAVAATTGTGGTTTMIAAGEQVILPDESALVLDGNAVRSSGRHLVDADSAVLTTVAGAEARVPAGGKVVRADRSVVELTAEMTATLTDGAPRPTLFREIFSDYLPDPTLVPATPLSPHPLEDLDFSPGGAYSVYNWELFFHIPFTIAVNLSRSGRYDEALRWFHLLFDPTTTAGEVAPERYWRVKPFQTLEVQGIEDILVNLSTGADPVTQRDTINAIQAWKDAPFRPHVVARFRQSAYMFKTVFAYLDNLVAWGDSLFRQDTGEAIDEALQLYVLAAVILGPRPQAVPSAGSVRTQSYSTLRGSLDEFANTMRDLEGSLLFDLAPRPAETSSAAALATVRSIGRSLYFSVPRNDKLMSYWDTVADRLFKIRNSLNIAGVFRQIPLFEPPIDPAMLARAAAAGVDTAAVVEPATLPLQRFSLMHRQASELAQQVATLGNAMLSALEKADGEALTLLRARHESTLAALTEQVKYGQVQETMKSREALLGSLNTAVTRYAYYERQLGKAPGDISVPELDELDLQALAAYNLRQTEPTMGQRDVPVDIAVDLVDEAAGRLLNRFEAEELDLLTTARTIQDVIKIAQLSGQGASMIPDFGVKFHFWGLGGDFGFGGTQLAKFARFAADVATTVADSMNFQAGVAAKVGSYARREQDWAQQSSLAASEITSVFKQLRAAQLREAVAEKEWRNHQTHIKQLAEVETFLNAEGTNPKGRVANEAMYAWLKRDLRLLHARTFALATGVAAKAERVLQHEIGDPNLTFLSSAYLEGNQGLLAGEKLLFDLKRMELAYHENNVRELEVTQHVSLAQLNPLELIRLRATGSCAFDIPEELLDLEGPGHYFRRLRSVSLSVPCVTGPYTSINCSLSLMKHSIRRQDTEEALEETHGAIQAIVASSGSQDTGIADTNGQDSRRLPFELAGAISSWHLDLPGRTSDGFRTFDYDTISDVVLHLHFTARQGNADKAHKRLAKLAKGDAGTDVGRVRLFSLRHEFASAWSAFIASDAKPAPLKITLTRAHFPFWSAQRIKAIEKVALYRPPASPGGNLDLLATFDGADVPKFDIPWTRNLDPKSKDIWLLATWKI